ncbi:hypothetical protein [Haloarchaeobius iranensis]|uniref:hypothetical protein n=1 Tax=Haloarchaeobius iranensis TaxID=996166 RepID=UPI001113BED0|nr:hypothetical protein [Haloarchaeobius iranensis]
MKEFNRLTDSVEIIEREESVLLRINDSTLGVNFSTDGFVLTPDWNSRHFTLAITDESVLYHMVREDEDDRTGGEGDLQPEGFVADMYTAIRALTPLEPVSETGIQQVGRINVDEAEGWLRDQAVIEGEGRDFTIDNERKNELEFEYNNVTSVRRDFATRFLEVIPLEDAIESGEIVFGAVDEDYYLYFVFLFPDRYIGIVRPNKLLNIMSHLRGSSVFHYLQRSMTDE